MSIEDCAAVGGDQDCCDLSERIGVANCIIQTLRPRDGWIHTDAEAKCYGNALDIVTKYLACCPSVCGVSDGCKPLREPAL